MIINKAITFQTDEEAEKKQILYYELFEKIKPLYESHEFHLVNKYIKKCLIDVQKIENEAKKRYILSLKGNQSAIIKDVKEILKESL